MRFYGFHEEGDGEEVRVTMEVVPHYGTTFEIWSKEEVRMWAEELDFTAIGAGTFSHDCEPDDEVGKMNWLGTFASSGDYFVVVKHEAGPVSYYNLTVSGKGSVVPVCGGTPASGGTSAGAAPQPAAAPQPGAAPAAAMAGESPGTAWRRRAAGWNCRKARNIGTSSTHGRYRAGA
jgi:hypothetical protein